MNSDMLQRIIEQGNSENFKLMHQLLLSERERERDVNGIIYEALKILDKDDVISEVERCEMCKERDIEYTCPYCPRFEFCEPCFRKIDEGEVLCPFCESVGLKV